jgi:tRNA (guanine37-N1)-methyltransferase
VKKNGIIHFYYWDREDDLFSKALVFVEKESKRSGRKVKILDKRKVLPYGPRIWKICIDFKVI